MRIQVTALALVLATALAYASGNALAHEPHPGLSFSISVDGVDGCNTRSGDATCEIPAGERFQLDVSLDELPDDIPNYSGFHAYVQYSGVVPNQEITIDVPQCAGTYNYQPGFFVFACGHGKLIKPATDYAGTLGRNSFVCAASGWITLAHDPLAAEVLGVETYTDLDERQMPPTPSESRRHSEGNGASETLNITCGAPFTPTPTPLPTSMTSGSPNLPDTGQGPASEPSSAIFLAVALGAAAVMLTALARLRVTRC